MFSLKLKAILGLLVILFALPETHAQINLGGGLSLSGNTSLQYQYYNSTAFNNGFSNIRQPTHYPQFNANLTLDWKNKLSIPLNIFITPVIQVGAFGVQTPAEGPKSLNPLQFLMHPANRLYARPSYKNFTFHLGHFIQHYSPLSTGDIKVFGVGADYQMNHMRVSLQRGIIQPKVPNNAFNFNNGAYRRTLTAINLVTNKKGKLNNGISFAFVDDHQNSLEAVPMARNPEKSAVLSLFSRYRVSKKTQVELEIANTSWAPNVTATDTLREFGVGSFLIPNTNILGGIGVAFKGYTKQEHFRLNTRVSWKSKHFRTLSFPFMQSDMIDVELNPQASFFNNDLQTNLVLAYKGSNVSKTYGSSLSIPIFKFNTSYKFNEQTFINVVYAFNAVNGSPNVNGDQVKSSNQVVRILPTYRFTTGELKNTASLILGLSQYSNKSTFLATPTKVSTNNYGVSYRVSYKKHSGGLSLNTFKTGSAGATLFRNNTITLSARTKVLNGKMTPYARITYTGVRNTDMKIGSKQVLQLGSNYKITGRTMASLGVSVLNNLQGTGQAVPGYREFLVRTSISHRL
ncbi:MAG: hypothetical protein JXR19_03680 [Bacteroidia bacterium]